MSVFRWMVFYFGLLTVTELQAQVSMTLQVPPTGVVQKSQLWNMVLVNSGTSTLTIGVELTLLGTADNRPVMKAATRLMDLTTGAHQLKAANLQPVQYNYLSSIFNVDLNPNGLLPIGNFIACYNVFTMAGELRMPLAEDCLPLEIQPLSAPLLNLPVDRAVLETGMPQFSWIPPSPVQLFSNLTYDFILVQVNQGQGTEEAIQQNVPLYHSGRLDKTVVNYPSSGKILDTGITYAWSVVARNNGQLVAQSETWTFRVSKGQPVKKPATIDTYIKLKSGLDASMAVSNGTIAVEYPNATGDSTVQYVIRSMEDGRNTVVASGVLPVRRGQNFLVLPPERLRRLEDNASYLLECINSRREAWSVKLLFYKEDN